MGSALGRVAEGQAEIAAGVDRGLEELERLASTPSDCIEGM